MCDWLIRCMLPIFVTLWNDSSVRGNFLVWILSSKVGGIFGICSRIVYIVQIFGWCSRCRRICMLSVIQMMLVLVCVVVNSCVTVIAMHCVCFDSLMTSTYCLIRYRWINNVKMWNSFCCAWHCVMLFVAYILSQISVTSSSAAKSKFHENYREFISLLTQFLQLQVRLSCCYSVRPMGQTIPQPGEVWQCTEATAQWKVNLKKVWIKPTWRFWWTFVWIVAMCESTPCGRLQLMLILLLAYR